MGRRGWIGLSCLFCVRLAAQSRDTAPAVYALGQRYSDASIAAVATFNDGQEDALWRRLLIADGFFANGRLVDAFTLYRDLQDRFPAMVTIHDSIAKIYEQSGHADWADIEKRAADRVAVDCAVRVPLCEFRAGRYQAAFDAALLKDDPESRYWRARAATELASAAFRRLETLPDSLERHSARAARARAEERQLDAIAEWKAALTFAPGNPVLTFELASSYYAARDYEQAVATAAPLLKAQPDDIRAAKLSGYALLRLRRLDEAIPLLARAAERDPADPGPRLALGRAYVQNGRFADAIPLLEPYLTRDDDGSVHVQVARAYGAIGQRDKADTLLEKSAELQRAADERAAAASRREITSPR